MEITGGCLCAAVRYRGSAEPIVTRTCWCCLCQYIGAGSATANVCFPSAAVTIQGVLRDYPSIADSDNKMHRRFCPECGTHLFSEAEARPHLIFVRAGTPDDPGVARPAMTIWTSQAPPWACIDPGIPRGSAAARGVSGTRQARDAGKPIRRALTALLAALGAAIALAPAKAAEPAAQVTIVDLPADPGGSPFPHYWERMFGSGRAALALRESYREDLRRMKAATDLQYVRFHAILHDELGIYDEDERGAPHYNFSYVDQIYDGLLAAGVRPCVELSFMPRQLAADPKLHHPFWYAPVISPPRDYRRWDALIEALARHLIERYGIEEVASWYFEVWNEPNLGFWGGVPRQARYFELYAHTARALKAVSPRLRVGGPATAQAAWVEEFIRYCHAHGVPVDFVSSHVYANDAPENVFHTSQPVSRERMVCRAVRKLHEEIRRSDLPQLPLLITEYNASFANEPNVTDTTYMGPWLASTIAQCDGLAEVLSYWTFSDVFEERGVVRTPFYGGFGLLAAGGIPKPAFNAFELLHRLGEVRLKVDADSVLATRRADGALVLALWHYAEPDATGPRYQAPQPTGEPRHFRIRLPQPRAGSRARLWRLDEDHGNVLALYDRMGRPSNPSREQIAELQRAGRNAEPETLRAADGVLEVAVPRHGLAVLEIE